MTQLIGLDWRGHGSCAGHATTYDNVVDATGQQSHKACEWFIHNFCHGCPVANKCLDWGKKTRSTGIFGGTTLRFGRTAAERRAARRLALSAAVVLATRSRTELSKAA